MRKQLKIFICACLVALSLTILLFLSGGCAAGPGHLSWQQSAYAWSTNAVSTAHDVFLPYVPPPYNGLLEGALAVSTGLLGIWGARLHKNVSELNGARKGPNVDPGPAKVQG